MKCTRLIIGILAAALSIVINHVLADEEDDKMTAIFVNLNPRDEIELFWVDPNKDEADPERLVRASQ